MRPKILIVEDDSDISSVLKLLAEDLGYDGIVAADGQSGLDLALADEFVLVLIDLMLPKLEGVEVCKRLRSAKRKIPIIALTAVADETSKVLLLELGADDYVTKPFSNRELKARIKTVLRRSEGPSEQEQQTKVQYRDLTIDAGTRQVTAAGKVIDLTAGEFDLIWLLAAHAGRPFSREQINEMLFGYHSEGYDESLNARVNRIRNKIETNRKEPEYIQTVRGIGYRFGDPQDF